MPATSTTRTVDGIPVLPAVRLPAPSTGPTSSTSSTSTSNKFGFEFASINDGLSYGSGPGMTGMGGRTAVSDASARADSMQGYSTGLGLQEDGSRSGLASSESESELISEADADDGAPGHEREHTIVHDFGLRLEEASSSSQHPTPTSRMNEDSDPLDGGSHAATNTSANGALTAAVMMESMNALSQPRLSRAFSMPVASQLGALQHPRRLPSGSGSLLSPSDSSPPTSIATATAITGLPTGTGDMASMQVLSLELADCIQSAIQTLLQLSPPQVLDQSKESLSACSVGIPTPSLSALFTSLKNLNYMAANMSAIGASPSSTICSAPGKDEELLRQEETTFDVGELLQSVGDAVSGLAAEAGVDVVLYHSDVGMKHVSVHGDECGVSYVLTHVVRQVIAVTKPGDSIEIGLDVTDVDPTTTSPTPDQESDSTKSEDTQTSKLSRTLKITYDIAHKFAFDSHSSSTTSPSSSRSRTRTSSPGSGPRPDRDLPSLDSAVLTSLLRRLGGDLKTDLPPKLFRIGRSSELSFTLPSSPSSSSPTNLSSPPPDFNSSTSDLRESSSEPTLSDLASFADSLRGRKVTLHASSKGSFAHHLSSYLTAWGLDVSHVAPAEEIPVGQEWVDDGLLESSGAVGEEQAMHAPSLSLGVEGLTPQLEAPLVAGSPVVGLAAPATAPPSLAGSAATSPAAVPTSHAATSKNPQGLPTPSSAQSSPDLNFASPPPIAGAQMSFVFVDDNVDVLRKVLTKARAECIGTSSGGASGSGAGANKARMRPSLAANHRPKSSPQVARALGLNPANPAGAATGYGQQQLAVIVHFTSLANYKLVKDVLQTVLSPSLSTTVGTSAAATMAARMPEVIVIPKPAGPRRFLTALHTAVTKPVVDPFFAPIATSPMSPGLHAPNAHIAYFPEHYQHYQHYRALGHGPGTQGSGPIAQMQGRPPPGQTSRTASDRSTGASSIRSPKDGPILVEAPTSLPPLPTSGSSNSLSSQSTTPQSHPYHYHQHQGHTQHIPPLPSPLSMGDRMEYFADAASKMGVPMSSGTGVVIKSPTGQPTGIFFPPRMPKGANAGAGGRSGTLPAQQASNGGAGSSAEIAGMTVSGSGSSRKSTRRRTSDPYGGNHVVGTPNPAVNMRRTATEIVEEALGTEPTPLDVSVGHTVMSAAAKVGRSTKSRSKVGAEEAGSAGGGLSVSPTALERPKDGNRRSSGSGIAAAGPPSSTSPASTSASAAGASGILAVPPTGDPSTQVAATPPMSPSATGDGTGKSGKTKRRPVRGGTKVAATPPTPVVVPAPGAAGKKKKATDGVIVPPISVLVVDDNPINQTILSTFMRRKKIKYDVAKNGEEAVQKWKTGGFHLILMDIQMPVMDGIEATKAIRLLEKAHGSLQSGTPIAEQEQAGATPSSSDSKAPPTPYRSSVIIVALTASSLQSDRVAALAAGCNDFLTKPVSLEWLNNKIIEWGSIKALQMWADLRPEVQRSIASGQAAQAQNVARKLHVPEGRATPNASTVRSRSSSTNGDSARSSYSPGIGSSARRPHEASSSLSNETISAGWANEMPASIDPDALADAMSPLPSTLAKPPTGSLSPSGESTPSGPSVIVTEPTPKAQLVEQVAQGLSHPKNRPSAGEDNDVTPMSSRSAQDKPQTEFPLPDMLSQDAQLDARAKEAEEVLEPPAPSEEQTTPVSETTAVATPAPDKGLVDPMTVAAPATTSPPVNDGIKPSRPHYDRMPSSPPPMPGADPFRMKFASEGTGTVDEDTAEDDAVHTRAD